MPSHCSWWTSRMRSARTGITSGSYHYWTGSVYSHSSSTRTSMSGSIVNGGMLPPFASISSRRTFWFDIWPKLWTGVRALFWSWRVSLHQEPWHRSWAWTNWRPFSRFSRTLSTGTRQFSLCSSPVHLTSTSYCRASWPSCWRKIRRWGKYNHSWIGTSYLSGWIWCHISTVHWHRIGMPRDLWLWSDPSWPTLSHGLNFRVRRRAIVFVAFVPVSYHSPPTRGALAIQLPVSCVAHHTTTRNINYWWQMCCELQAERCSLVPSRNWTEKRKGLHETRKTKRKQSLVYSSWRLFVVPLANLLMAGVVIPWMWSLLSMVDCGPCTALESPFSQHLSTHQSSPRG